MEISNGVTERSVMSASVEAATLLRQIAGNGEPGESKKAAWLRAYRRVQRFMTFNRVKDLWRQEPRAKVSADELHRLRDVAGCPAGAQDDLVARLEYIEQRLRQIDEAFHCEDIDTLRRAVGALGRYRPS